MINWVRLLSMCLLVCAASCIRRSSRASGIRRAGNLPGTTSTLVVPSRLHPRPIPREGRGAKAHGTLGRPVVVENRTGATARLPSSGRKGDTRRLHPAVHSRFSDRDSAGGVEGAVRSAQGPRADSRRGQSMAMLVVNPSIGVSSIKQLIAARRQSPASLRSARRATPRPAGCASS